MNIPSEDVVEKKGPKDYRNISSIGFGLLLGAYGAVVGYLFPGFDPTAEELFPYSITILSLVAPLICIIYYWIQTSPLAVGEVGSITSVANDAVVSIIPGAAIGIILLAWWFLPEFDISIFVFGQFVLASIFVAMDVIQNGRIGATINRLVSEYKSQR